jgi:hypothetical protein
MSWNRKNFSRATAFFFAIFFAAKENGATLTDQSVL